MTIYKSLNPDKALIWRIVHRDNLPWIFEHGLHAGNSDVKSDNWVHIGNPELTDKRVKHLVPVGMGGYLNDYVPFYFTPFSPMLMNIRSGRGGVSKRDNEDIVILVSSLHRIASLGLDFVFTNGHAYYQWTDYFTDLQDLDKVDWSLLQHRDFKRDDADPRKFERYQAEALVHQYCPLDALVGIVCYNDAVKLQIEQWLAQRDLSTQVLARAGWYFS
jgi:hypothetical protein